MHSDTVLRARSEGIIYVEGIVDRAGCHGVYVFHPSSGSSDVLILSEQDRADLLSKLFSDPDIEKVFFGCHSLRAAGLHSFESAKLLTDIDLLYGAEHELGDLVRRELSENDYVGLLEAASKFEAYITAAKTARVPLASVSARSIMPPKFFESFYRMRAVRALALRTKLSQKRSWKPQSKPSLFDRLSIGLAGPEVDGYMSSGKLAFPKFCVIGGKTKRIGLRTGSPNCMSIQKGPARKAIRSRFVGGKIASLDFNAIDYRCIVSAIPKLKEMYDDCEDFHAKTVEILTGRTDFDSELRFVFKKLTYVHFYGGSIQSCQKVTGLSVEKIEAALAAMEKKLAGIDELKDLFWKNGMVALPDEMERPHIEYGTHPGARLAYFAQTCSSHVFKVAVAALCEEMARRALKSKLMFTVHDEVDLDVHPDEVQLLPSLKEVMERSASQCMGIRFSVSLQTGDSYGDID